MPYVVGGTQQFTHVERDADGNAIAPPASGTWRVADPSLVAITPNGLARWLAPGVTAIFFALENGDRIAIRNVEIIAATPADLVATPSPLSVPVNGAATISVTATDEFANPVTSFELTSVLCDDTTVATVVRGIGTDILIVGAAVGTCTITIESGDASTTVSVTTTALPATGVSTVFGRAGAVTKQAGDYAVADITGAASTSDVSAAVAALVNSSPAALNTLKELADALGDDPNFATTINTALATKATMSALSSEATTRASADTTLQGNITAEASTRSAADIALQANIDAEAAARTSAISAAIAALVNSSPSTLDTLKELADALGDDPNYATTVTTALGLKAPLASPALTGTPTAPTATLGDSTTKIATTAFVAAAAAAVTPAWSAITSKPTTIAGISAGVATDFNTLGDARWLKQLGGTIYNGADGAATIALNIGSSGAARNALKVWGNIFIGNNNDKIIDSTNSGFLHLGSSGGTTIGYAAGTVILKAVTAGVTLSAPLIIPTGAAPASASAAGVAGQHAWDSGFLYICTATNTWKRVAVATF